MGIFAWLDKQFPYDRKEKEELFNGLQEALTEAPQSSKGISEPVASLIESLGRDEWELDRIPYVSLESYSLTNVFHEHLRLLLLGPTAFNNSANLCGCDWMTGEEKKVVASAAFVRAMSLKDLRIRQQHKQDRSEYMILVKEEV